MTTWSVSEDWPVTLRMDMQPVATFHEEEKARWAARTLNGEHDTKAELQRLRDYMLNALNRIERHAALSDDKGMRVIIDDIRRKIPS